MIKDVYAKFKEGEIEYRVYIVAAVIGMLFSTIAGVLSFALDLGLLIVGSCFFMAAITILFIFLSHKAGEYIVLSYIIVIALGVIFLPLIWIASGGSLGTAPYFYVFNYMMMAVLLNQAKVKWAVIINTVAILVLLFVEWQFPSLIIQYESDKSRLIDFGAMLIIISIACFLLVYRIMKDYHRKMEMLNKTQIEINDKAATDSLTGLKNRGYMLNAIEEETNNLNGEYISVYLMDIDHLKKINESYGQYRGDEVIIKIAKILEEVVDSSAELGRIGDDEYMIILKNNSYKNSYTIAQSICDRIANMKWDEIRMPITVSLGGYYFDQPESSDRILENAYRCLLDVKKSGGNGVEIYNM